MVGAAPGHRTIGPRGSRTTGRAGAFSFVCVVLCLSLCSWRSSATFAQDVLIYAAAADTETGEPVIFRQAVERAGLVHRSTSTLELLDSLSQDPDLQIVAVFSRDAEDLASALGTLQRYVETGGVILVMTSYLDDVFDHPIWSSLGAHVIVVPVSFSKCRVSTSSKAVTRSSPATKDGFNKLSYRLLQSVTTTDFTSCSR